MCESKCDCDMCGETLSGPLSCREASDGLRPLCEKCLNIHEYELTKRIANGGK